MKEDKSMTLNKVPVGEACIVESLDLSGIMRRRLQDLGMVPGTKIVPTKKSSSGGPTAYRIRGSVYALREDDASHIQCTSLMN